MSQNTSLASAVLVMGLVLKQKFATAFNRNILFKKEKIHIADVVFV